MTFNRIICLCSLLFFIGCNEATFSKQPTKPSGPPSPLAQKAAKLVEKSIDLLQKKSGAQPQDTATLVNDFKTGASAMLQEVYLDRFEAFVEELKADAESMQNLIQVKNILLDTTPPGKLPTPEENAAKIRMIANNPELIELLFKIKNELYSPDGRLLRDILTGAADDADKRETLLRGLTIGNCEKYDYPEEEGWLFSQKRCAIITGNAGHMLWYSGKYGTLLQQFAETPLKKHLDSFEKKAEKRGGLEDSKITWIGIKLIKIIDYKSLDWLRDYVKDMDEAKMKGWLLFLADFIHNPRNKQLQEMFAELEPELRDLGHEIVMSYTGKPLKEMTWQELHKFLDKLDGFLKNEQHGPKWFMK